MIEPKNSIKKRHLFPLFCNQKNPVFQPMSELSTLQFSISIIYNFAMLRAFVLLRPEEADHNLTSNLKGGNFIMLFHQQASRKGNGQRSEQKYWSSNNKGMPGNYLDNTGPATSTTTTVHQFSLRTFGCISMTHHARKHRRE